LFYSILNGVPTYDQKKAFTEYINNRQSKNVVMHVEDIAIENSSFAEAFYVIAGAIYEIGK
jgi:hypothetical protein